MNTAKSHRLHLLPLLVMALVVASCSFGRSTQSAGDAGSFDASSWALDAGIQAPSDGGVDAPPAALDAAAEAGASDFSIGGTVTGLVGTGLVLRDNGGDDLPVATNGAFTFKTRVPAGQPYAV